MKTENLSLSLISKRLDEHQNKHQNALCDGCSLLEKCPSSHVPPLQIELLINNQDLRTSVIASDHLESTSQPIFNASMPL